MSSTTIRGADIVMRTLERAGHHTIFTLSGNHIMSMFDAAIDTRHRLVHTRHEAASVHMADAWGRLTGEPGIAMVTGGPGHANAAAALMTAQGQESPLVLLSGHTETDQLGRGGFQELRQAEVAAPMAKASWTATSVATLGTDVAKALRIARSGRPGPVHLSLPSNLLDATMPADDIAWPDSAAFAAPAVALGDAAADAILGIVATALRPFVLAGPAMANRTGRDLLARIEKAMQVPTAIMESPRGFNDATLGAFADAIRRADLIVLLGKAFDFTLRFGAPPSIDAACRWIVIDPEAPLVDRAIREKADQVVFACIADTRPAGEALIRRAAARDGAWLAEARALLTDRPSAWEALASKTPGKLHPIEVFRALLPRERLREFSLLLHPDKTRLIEFGRFAAQNREKRGLGKPETFKFLGFVLISGKSRRGDFQIRRKSRRDRMSAKLREIKEALRERRHVPVPEVGKWLAQVVAGYFAYHAVPTNSPALSAFRYHVVVLWHRQLCRRSQRAYVVWERMAKLADEFLPKPRVLHPWPSVRFAVRHPR